MKKICIISQQHFHNKHVSEDTVDAFENAIVKNENLECLKINISELIYKINRRLGDTLAIADYRTIKKIKDFQPNLIFIMAMSPGILQNEIQTLSKLNIPKLIYCIDTWESRTLEWKDVLNRSLTDHVLCAYLKSVETFSKFTKYSRYMPYSMNDKYFYPRSLKKEHLFMQMGRKNKTLHEYTLKYIEEHGLDDSDYIREKECGRIIYQDFDTLAKEINKTWFFIVSPRNIDEEKITGTISDVTARYYEGMACKTLLVGYKPNDSFDMLFPQKGAMFSVHSYSEFSKIIDYFRYHTDEYFKIVNNNYEHLINHHTWEERAKRLVNYIDEINQEKNL